MPMACRILQLPREVLLNIIDTFRQQPPSYCYRTLPSFAGKSYEELSADRLALSNISLSCKAFLLLSKAALYEHFTPFEVWPGRCPADSVSRMSLNGPTAGLRMIQYLYLEIPRHDHGRNLPILQAAILLKRLHLAIMMGHFQQQAFQDAFSHLVNLETVTLSFNHSPDAQFAARVFNAISKIPNLRALSMDTVNGLAGGSHSLENVPLRQIEFRDIQFSKTHDVRYILQRWNLKNLHVLAFKCCNVSDDILSGIRLARLRTLRLHSCSVARIPYCKSLLSCASLTTVSFDSIFHVLLIDRISGLPPQIAVLELVRPATADIEAILTLLGLNVKICPKLKLIRLVRPVLGHIEALVSKNLAPLECMRVWVDKRDNILSYRSFVECLYKW